MSERAVLSRVNLVLGGARSGKSAFAETLIDQSGLDKVYLATAEAHDAEMAARIAVHQARRDNGWTTVEEPLDLVGVLTDEARPNAAVLVDCLTLWLSNLLASERDVERETAGLLAALASHPGPVVLVSNEVGMGIVPENALARAFRDCQGRLNCQVAEVSELVVFMAAGLPLVLKSPDWDPIKKDML